MYIFSMPILLPPFAGCQSAFSQNHSQNVNEVLLTLAVTLLIGKSQVALVISNRHSINHRKIIGGGKAPGPPLLRGPCSRHLVFFTPGIRFLISNVPQSTYCNCGIFLSLKIYKIA